MIGPACSQNTTSYLRPDNDVISARQPILPIGRANNKLGTGTVLAHVSRLSWWGLICKPKCLLSARREAIPDPTTSDFRARHAPFAETHSAMHRSTLHTSSAIFAKWHPTSYRTVTKKMVGSSSVQKKLHLFDEVDMLEWEVRGAILGSNCWKMTAIVKTLVE